jgi:hypothetical protein
MAGGSGKWFGISGRKWKKLVNGNGRRMRGSVVAEIRTETGTNACAMRPGVGWKADVAGQEACSTVW